MATKTTSVVFKQHDTQIVADLSGVAGALILEVHPNAKHDWFLELPGRKMVPIDDLGGRDLLPIFDFENMAIEKISHFFGFVFNIFIHKMRRLAQETTNKFLTEKWPHKHYRNLMPTFSETNTAIVVFKQHEPWNKLLEISGCGAHSKRHDFQYNYIIYMIKIYQFT